MRIGRETHEGVVVFVPQRASARREVELQQRQRGFIIPAVLMETAQAADRAERVAILRSKNTWRYKAICEELTHTSQATADCL